MKIEHRRPFARGVDTLMYVGDSDAVAVEKDAMPDAKTLGIGALALMVALKSKGIISLAAGTVAAYVGVKVYEAKK